MPLDTERYVFDEEIDRLEQECQEVAEDLASIAGDNPAAAQLQRHGNRLDSFLSGLRWAHDEWDVDGVTLGGLTGGEYGHVEDELGGDAGQGKARVYYVAKGTVEAPYLSDDDDGTGLSDEAVANVAALPIGYLRWADARINDLMGPSGNAGKRFGDWLAEARQTATDETDN